MGSGQTPFVGRERELGVLAGALADARAGRGRLVAVVGDAGIGKTRLVTHAASLLGAGTTVVAGRCDEDPLLTYQPFAEIVAPLLADAEAVRALGSAIAPLALIAPDLSTRCDWLTIPEVVDGEAARAAAVPPTGCSRRWRRLRATRAKRAMPRRRRSSTSS